MRPIACSKVAPVVETAIRRDAGRERRDADFRYAFIGAQVGDVTQAPAPDGDLPALDEDGGD